MHRTGFEPARLAPYELESYPLDHSGTYAAIVLNYINFFLNHFKIKIKYIYKY